MKQLSTVKKDGQNARLEEILTNSYSKNFRVGIWDNFDTENYLLGN